MNTEYQENVAKVLPGALLASIRSQKGFSTAYVAGKLHLRVRLIELLEVDDYDNMPEPVFIKGYLRAYAKLLEVSPEPLLETFNQNYLPLRKPERALWQSKRETYKGENVIRWLTALFTLGVLIAVAVWWSNNKDFEHIFPKATVNNDLTTTTAVLENKEEPANREVSPAELSKIQSMLPASNEFSPMEKEVE
jgi:cytoskeleton protein RodZ